MENFYDILKKNSASMTSLDDRRKKKLEKLISSKTKHPGKIADAKKSVVVRLKDIFKKHEYSEDEYKHDLGSFEGFFEEAIVEIDRVCDDHLRRLAEERDNLLASASEEGIFTDIDEEFKKRKEDLLEEKAKMLADGKNIYYVKGYYEAKLDFLEREYVQEIEKRKEELKDTIDPNRMTSLEIEAQYEEKRKKIEAIREKAKKSAKKSYDRDVKKAENKIEKERPIDEIDDDLDFNLDDEEDDLGFDDDLGESKKGKKEPKIKVIKKKDRKTTLGKKTHKTDKKKSKVGLFNNFDLKIKKMWLMTCSAFVMVGNGILKAVKGVFGDSKTREQRMEEIEELKAKRQGLLDERREILGSGHSR